MPDSETSWTVAHQAPLFMEVSRQEYWSGLPFPSAGDLPNPGMEPSECLLPLLAYPKGHQVWEGCRFQKQRKPRCGYSGGAGRCAWPNSGAGRRVDGPQKSAKPFSAPASKSRE